MITEQFDSLTPAELLTLEQHLKLGMAHLKNHLTEEEIKQLLKPPLLNSTQMRKMGENEAEISGNLTRILNTVFTATFGAWTGYSRFLESNINSVFALGSVITLAGILGALIGYQNIQFTKKQAKEAIHNQKLLILQLAIVKKVEKKRKEEILAIIDELDHLFLDLSRGTSLEKKIDTSDLSDKSKWEVSKWVEKVEIMGKEKLTESSNPLIRETCAGEWAEIQAELERNSTSLCPQKEKFEVIHEEGEKREKALDASVHKLIHTPPKQPITPPSWIRTNAQSLILGLVPTVLGGFSSISVYLGGMPLILKNFGYMEAFEFLTNPTVKAVQVGISVLLTLYFGFSFILSNRKAFKRYREQEKTSHQIVHKESTLTLLDAELLNLKELKKSSLQLMKFFKIADKITSAAEKKKSKSGLPPL